MELCKICGVYFEDIREYRRNKCRSCYNKKQKQLMRDRASTPRGFFEQSLSSIKNDKNRRHVVDIDVDCLVDLYNEQEGKCALSGLEMDLGYISTRNPKVCSIDRINNDNPYTKDNIRLVMLCVNHFKLTMSDDDMLHIAKNIVENNMVI